MIVAIPFTAENKERAERLLDGIYWIGEKKRQGHCILVPSFEVHPEFRRKCAIAAELSFNTVEMISLPQVNASQVNHAFEATALTISNGYRLPWLWLEPECVPLKKTWMTELFGSYSQQPKRYMGRFMNAQAGTFMNRVGIYPPDAYRDLSEKLSGVVPFERVAGIVPRATQTKLIEVVTWKPGDSRPLNAVLLNCDRTGSLIEEMIEEAPAAPNRIAKAPTVAK